MRCSFCNNSFTIDESKSACGRCKMKDCNLVKCPKCGYENVKESKFIKNIIKIFKK